MSKGKNAEITKDKDQIRTIRGILAEILPNTNLLENEDINNFECLNDIIINELRPQSFLEHVYVKEIADKIWELQRLERIKSSTINAAKLEAIEYIFLLIFSAGCPIDKKIELDAISYANSIICKDEHYKSALSILKQYDYGKNEIEAMCFKIRVGELSSINQLMRDSSFRRDRAYKKLIEHQERASRISVSLSEVTDVDTEGDPQ